MENIMSETTGQKPTNKNLRFEDGRWWYVGANDGARRSLEAHIKKNENRMFVNGKYIPKGHPLHKPGRYEGFQDAAFNSLENYSTNLKGEIYILYNPHFQGWCKIGMAVDSNDRLKSYQTSSPYRDYRLHKCYFVDDRREAEQQAHTLIEENHTREGEWFICPPTVAESILDKYFLKGTQLELFS